MIQKQNVNINFSQGLDTKTDPYQIPIGKFLTLENTVFNQGGLLQKRNGYTQLASLPDNTSKHVTPFNGNLIAVDNAINAYSSGSGAWINKGLTQPILVDALPLVRNSQNQSQADSVTAPSGNVCTAYTESDGSTVTRKYIITDGTTGQSIVAPIALPTTSGTVIGSPKVFLLGSAFVVVYGVLIGSSNHIQFITINTVNPTTVTAPADLTSIYSPSATMAFDGVVSNNTLFVAYNATDVGGGIRVVYLNSALTASSEVVFGGYSCTLMSVAADNSATTPIIYCTFFNDATNNGYVLAINQNLDTILSPTQIITTTRVLNINSVVLSSVLHFHYEIENSYTYDAAIPTNYVRKNTITQAGVVGTSSVMIRSVGLASKAFLIDDIIYMLVAYQSVFQPTYFLINDSGQVISKIGYSNGGGYLTTGLPPVNVSGNTVSTTYLFKDLIQAVNKEQGLANAAGIYSQTGVNLVTFTFNTSNIVTADIGGNLNISGGMVWAYDGFSSTEQNFHLWADNVEVTFSSSGGNITDQTYFYSVIYSWTDQQGNIFNSAPSIPVTVVTSGGNISSNTISVPTLRLTYKTNVKIQIYRWSTAQQSYFQVTSRTSPLISDPTADSVQFVDTLADSSILGNELIYTTGGVIENIAPPASNIMTLYKSRLFLVDAENKNLLWFSKEVIQSTPVEMNDSFTIFVAPTIGSQGSTGDITALSSMDDKLILFKPNAMFYITGSGPNNLSTQNDFSEPIFITSTVGCSNQQSIVFTPKGILFQSNKGIYLLGRDLSADNYIGSPVQQFTKDALVNSANTIPGTNQVRFTLDSGITLVYDYFYDQWSTFKKVPAISSTIFQNLHTYINASGEVFQETIDSYVDRSTPVTIKFTTGWLNPAGLQGYIRSFFFYLLGTYYSPHKLLVSIAYDYNSSPEQSVLISPTNFAPTYGTSTPYGQEQYYGGPSNVENWRVFLKKQRCMAFQITVEEIYDASFGVAAGQGLTLSGLNLVVGVKKGWTPIAAVHSAGTR